MLKILYFSYFFVNLAVSALIFAKERKEYRIVRFILGAINGCLGWIFFILIVAVKLAESFLQGGILSAGVLGIVPGLIAGVVIALLAVYANYKYDFIYLVSLGLSSIVLIALFFKP